MQHPVRIALLSALLALGTAATGHAHGGGIVGPPGGDLSFSDPAAGGIGYEWTVTGHRGTTVQLSYGVGAKSWSEPSNPEGSKGWTHTSNWIALQLDQDATVKITVERQQGVVVLSDTGVPGVGRFGLVPALSIYDGWDDTTQTEQHTFNNVGNFWSTVVYRASVANPKSKPRVAWRGRLPAGKYSVVIGGNPASLGDPGNYPIAGCDVGDDVCYRYTGVHGYRVTIQTR